MVKQIEPTGSYMISRAAGCRAMGRTERVNQRRLRGRMYLKNDFPIRVERPCNVRALSKAIRFSLRHSALRSR